MAAFDDSKPTFGTYEDRAVWLIGKLLPDFPKWTALDAFACAGNLGGESLIQMVQEAGQTPPNGGWGLAQWTGARRVQFDDYCARTQRDTNAMRSGYDFLFVELRGAFARVIDQVAAAPDLAAKVLAFEQHFEMAGIPRIGDRLTLALRAQKAWEARAPLPVIAPPPPGQPAPTQGSTFMSASFWKLIMGALAGGAAFIGPMLPPPWNLVAAAVMGSGIFGHTAISAATTDHAKT